ncbi:hypothetical protein CHL79_15940 [Delftia acidovorans]|uniref:hypothetical protein n=1 Tax=Delftia acidovorans TaxID=80866 RepID=UPI000BC2D26D|nr:hypothetical protein [Delftia acidovorans]ATH13808.1 hypothetical protein CHL79_15940 [Delftia acidovorans]
MNLADLSAPEFQRLVALHSQPPAMAPALRRLPPPPVAPEFAGLSPEECRARLRMLKDDAVRRASNGRWSDAEAREWTSLHISTRMTAVLLAGIEGEMEELAHREWRELPPPERTAIKAQLRYLADELAGLRSLTLRN